MRKSVLTLVALGLALAALAPVAPVAAAEPAAPAAEKSLYLRLGGYDAIAAVVDDFVPRLATDPQLAPFFAGHSQDTLQRIRQHVVDQLCQATGGPCIYTGRDMKTAHHGLGITGAQWDLSVTHLVESLDKYKVPAREKQELLSIASTLKAQIVEKP
jgi:hemoglobin